MPIYEYACKSCGHTLDALQKISEDPLIDCPECGQPDLKRLLSAPRFRLKGSGWYETDFKNDNRRNLAKGDSEPDKAAKTEKAGKADKTDSKSGTSASESKPKPGADKAASS